MLFNNKQNLVSDSIVSSAAMQERDRKARLREAWIRYWGNHPKPLLRSDADPEAKDNVIFNLARKTVDISAFYLFGKECEFEVGDAKDSPADEWLKKCWDANRKMTMLLEFATSSGIHGDGYIRIYPPNKAARREFPRIVSLDAENLTVDTDPVDYTDVRCFKIEFTSVDMDAGIKGQATRHRHKIERDKSTGRWSIIEQESRGDRATWIDVNVEDWPYSFPPVFHTKNRPAPHSFYGASDIEDDVLGLNDGINFVLSNLNRVLRIHGHPLTYGTGFNADQMDRAADAFMCLPVNGEIKNVEMVTQLEAHFSQLDELRQAFHELTNVPEIASGKVENIGQLSGLALQILYGPLTQLTTVKRMYYGEMLVDLNMALLEMGGHGEKVVTTIKWPQMLPSSRKEEAETAEALQAAGVSKSTTLTELGYDPDEESTKRDEEGASLAETALSTFNRGKGVVPVPAGGQ